MERREATSIHTSLILDFKKGFIIYHVDVRKVKAKTKTSVFPESSNLSGDVLAGRFRFPLVDSCVGGTYRTAKNKKSTISSMIYSGRARNDMGTLSGNGSLLIRVSIMNAALSALTRTSQ